MCWGRVCAVVGADKTASLAPVTASEAESATAAALPPLCRRVSQPDAARVEGMNTLTQQLWPHIEAAACKLLLKDAFLEKLLNGTAFWRPSMLMRAHIGVQAVILGQV